MKILLDTHCFLWFFTGDAKLSNNARSAIESASNEKLISVASFWEMSIKSSLGKLDLQLPFAELAARVLTETDSTLLALTVSHLAVLQQLPFHHRDPFDRVLVAQAQDEGLTIVSKDKEIQAYGVAQVW
ncbi:MAG: type II toxin-antitoxin system VapC family toxin [Planctomycetes bacterium]|nr:type II toxin-antitoxin system VapC family toxin [Planctomycetota bacterium]